MKRIELLKKALAEFEIAASALSDAIEPFNLDGKIGEKAIEAKRLIADFDALQSEVEFEPEN